MTDEDRDEARASASFVLRTTVLRSEPLDFGTVKTLRIALAFLVPPAAVASVAMRLSGGHLRLKLRGTDVMTLSGNELPAAFSLSKSTLFKTDSWLVVSGPTGEPLEFDSWEWSGPDCLLGLMCANLPGEAIFTRILCRDDDEKPSEGALMKMANS